MVRLNSAGGSALHGWGLAPVDSVGKTIPNPIGKEQVSQIYCSHCGKIYRLENQKRFKCASCRKQFSIRTNSILAGNNGYWRVLIHYAS